MTDHPLVTLLPWDTQHFGVSVARIADNTDAGFEDAHAWCVAHDVDVVYFLCSAARLDRAAAATTLGYRMVDLRLTFAMPTERWVSPGRGRQATVRRTRVDDLDELAKIARTAHRNTRFRADGGFDPDRCDALYAEWVANAVRNADPVWTAEIGSEVVGYLTGSISKTDSGSEGRISLIAVSEDARGSGAGRELVATANDWFAGQRCTTLAVGTQGANSAATNLYESVGYRLETIELWHHWRRSHT